MKMAINAGNANQRNGQTLTIPAGGGTVGFGAGNHSAYRVCVSAQAFLRLTADGSTGCDANDLLLAPNIPEVFYTGINTRFNFYAPAATIVSFGYLVPDSTEL